MCSVSTERRYNLQDKKRYNSHFYERMEIISSPKNVLQFSAPFQYLEDILHMCFSG